MLKQKWIKHLNFSYYCSIYIYNSQIEWETVKFGSLEIGL